MRATPTNRWTVKRRGTFLDVIDAKGRSKFTFDESQCVRAALFAQEGPKAAAAQQLRDAALKFTEGLNDPPVDDTDSACAKRNARLLRAAVIYAKADGAA
jgi:hypothetical protein